MPSDIIAKHPVKDFQISFFERGHSYKDNLGRPYTSVTKLVHAAFPEFDADRIAGFVAARDGRDKQQVLLEWEEKRKASATRGTRVHENVETLIKEGRVDRNKPVDDGEKIRFEKAYQAARKLTENAVSVETEKLVFSPDLLIAGSIDLLVQRAPGEWLMADWKILSKPLDYKGYHNEKGSKWMTADVPNANFYHYSLQQQIYENLLRGEGYIEPEARMTKILMVWSDAEQKFTPVKTQPMADIAWRIMIQGNR